MADYDYGPLRTYEVTWIGRPPEIVQGHSVQFDSGGFMRPPGGINRFRIYGMFPGGHWRLVLMGLEDSVACIRDITDHLAELEAMAEESPDGV
jgi:hypothetical protein